MSETVDGFGSVVGRWSAVIWQSERLGWRRGIVKEVRGDMLLVEPVKGGGEYDGIDVWISAASVCATSRLVFN